MENLTVAMREILTSLSYSGQPEREQGVTLEKMITLEVNGKFEKKINEKLWRYIWLAIQMSAAFVVVGCYKMTATNSRGLRTKGLERV